MHAILVMEGKIFSIYALEYKGKSEIVSFLKDRSIGRGIISGFHKILEYIADNGIKLPSEHCKLMKIKGNKFYQIDKGRHRITFIRIENKILLLTHFIKTRQYQSEEYDRVIRLLNNLGDIKWQN